jgi:hypothetical protein
MIYGVINQGKQVRITAAESLIMVNYLITDKKFPARYKTFLDFLTGKKKKVLDQKQEGAV